jgi:hypothetical protein
VVDINFLFFFLTKAHFFYIVTFHQNFERCFMVNLLPLKKNFGSVTKAQATAAIPMIVIIIGIIICPGIAGAGGGP